MSYKNAGITTKLEEVYIGDVKRMQPVTDPTPGVVEVPLKKPESIDEIVAKNLLRRQYMENLNNIATNMGAGQEIDDEYESDEQAFTAAEAEYRKGQVDLKEKKEKFFQAAQEKEASRLAKEKEEYKKKVEAEYKKLNPPKEEPIE